MSLYILLFLGIAYLTTLCYADLVYVSQSDYIINDSQYCQHVDIQYTVAEGSVHLPRSKTMRKTLDLLPASKFNVNVHSLMPHSVVITSYTPFKCPDNFVGK